MKSDARKVLQKFKRKLAAQATIVTPLQSTYDVIERCSKHLVRPGHLDPYVQKLDQAIKIGDMNAVFHAPPQHGKTQCAEHALIFGAIWDAQTGRQARRHAYSTFNFDRAYVIRNETQRIAFEAGLDPHSAGGLMTLSGGAEIRFGGAVSGQLTGAPVDGLHVMDDVLKDRKEAYSKVTREDRWNWFKGVAQTRRHPGSSTLCMMTRWHEDDLSGRLIRLMKWPYLRLAAICDAPDDPCGRQIGEALWEAQRPISWLKQFMADVLTWAAMYQGSPRPVGDALFDAAKVQYYDALPQAGGYRIGYGADLSYTEKTRADYSVLLGGRMYGPDLYLTKMIRRQVQAPEFTSIMKAASAAERGPIVWYGNSTEKGVADFVRQKIPLFRYIQATTDKYQRAFPTAERLWIPLHVFLPRTAVWREDFESEVCSFTGQGDAHDDIVDAFAGLGHLFTRGLTGKFGTTGLNQQLRAALNGGRQIIGRTGTGTD